MKVVGVIPARYGSTRLEGKPLADICGWPMIRHVYAAASRARLLDQVVVATDDARVLAAVEAFGGQARLTSPACPTGSDRIAEVVAGLDVDIVVNVQGDEPLLESGMIDEVVQPLLDDPALPTCTLCYQIAEEAKLADPNVVKVVCDCQGYALYFSRSLIPYPRKRVALAVYEHIGLYAYRKDFLLHYVQMPQTPLELTESLEQLRVLENGYKMRAVTTRYTYGGLSVDTAEDLAAVRAIVAARQQAAR
jgi:3-deoxy-manno-octulosonate cytidylyltransferase (CMP-KDO synthetase)